MRDRNSRMPSSSGIRRELRGLRAIPILSRGGDSRDMIGTGSISSTLVSKVETLRGRVRGESMIGTGADSGRCTSTGAETGLSGRPESLTASACSVESPPSPAKVDREISENRRAWRRTGLIRNSETREDIKQVGSGCLNVKVGRW